MPLRCGNKQKQQQQQRVKVNTLQDQTNEPSNTALTTAPIAVVSPSLHHSHNKDDGNHEKERIELPLSSTTSSQVTTTATEEEEAEEEERKGEGNINGSDVSLESEHVLRQRVCRALKQVERLNSAENASLIHHERVVADLRRYEAQARKKRSNVSVSTFEGQASESIHSQPDKYKDVYEKPIVFEKQEKISVPPIRIPLALNVNLSSESHSVSGVSMSASSSTSSLASLAQSPIPPSRLVRSKLRCAASGRNEGAVEIDTDQDVKAFSRSSAMARKFAGIIISPQTLTCRTQDESRMSEPWLHPSVGLSSFSSPPLNSSSSSSSPSSFNPCVSPPAPFGFTPLHANTVTALPPTKAREHEYFQELALVATSGATHRSYKDTESSEAHDQRDKQTHDETGAASSSYQQVILENMLMSDRRHAVYQYKESRDRLPLSLSCSPPSSSQTTCSSFSSSLSATSDQCDRSASQPLHLGKNKTNGMLTDPENPFVVVPTPVTVPIPAARPHLGHRASTVVNQEGAHAHFHALAHTRTRRISSSAVSSSSSVSPGLPRHRLDDDRQPLDPNELDKSESQLIAPHKPDRSNLVVTSSLSTAISRPQSARTRIAMDKNSRPNSSPSGSQNNRRLHVISATHSQSKITNVEVKAPSATHAITHIARDKLVKSRNAERDSGHTSKFYHLDFRGGISTDDSLRPFR